MLYSLITQDLSYNKLKKLPGRQMVFWLGFLQKLNLSNNRMTDLPVRHPPLPTVALAHICALCPRSPTG